MVDRKHFFPLSFLFSFGTGGSTKREGPNVKFWKSTGVSSPGTQEMRGEVGGITDTIYTEQFFHILTNYILLNNQLINTIVKVPSYFLVGIQKLG